MKTGSSKLTSTIADRYSNELLLGYQRIRDKRNLPNQVPLIFVAGDRAGTSLAAGSDRFSQGNSLDQDIYEVTDNLTFSKGAHLLTVGTHNEFFHFANVFFPASLGVWSFLNADSLAAGRASRYEIALPLRPGGPNTDFHVKQFGFYAQDQITPRPGLTITAGVRVDIPNMDSPFHNLSIDSVLSVNTGAFPSGNLLWSPRLGFNYDLTGDRTTQLRGGVGIFSGRPPYVWMSNAYGNTGKEQASLICDGPGPTNGTVDTVPQFTADPKNQPTHCGPIGALQSASSVVYFDQRFRFPQNLKVALGVDRRLTWGMVGTLDFLYTKSINQFYITDVNLQGITGYEAGEGGRPMYGNPGAATVTPLRRSARWNDVLEHSNRSDDRSYSMSAQVQKQFANGLEFNVSYTYSHTEDLFSLTSSIASSNYRFTALDGTIANRNLRTSDFDIPHKVTVAGTADIKYGVQLSLIYIGQSGSPYTYVVSNDVNGDGFGGNDEVYVPRNSGDISGLTAAQFTTLDNYINSEPCLQDNRGHLLPRNSCRNPWTNFLNLTLAKTVPTLGGQSAELRADIFNLPNLLNGDWGLIRSTTTFEEVNLLRQTGYDATNARGTYALALPQHNRVSTNSSRWRIQLGVKYTF